MAGERPEVRGVSLFGYRRHMPDTKAPHLHHHHISIVNGKIEKRGFSMSTEELVKAGEDLRQAISWGIHEVKPTPWDELDEMERNKWTMTAWQFLASRKEPTSSELAKSVADDIEALEALVVQQADQLHNVRGALLRENQRGNELAIAAKRVDGTAPGMAHTSSGGIEQPGSSQGS